MQLIVCSDSTRPATVIRKAGQKLFLPHCRHCADLVPVDIDGELRKFEKGPVRKDCATVHREANGDCRFDNLLDELARCCRRYRRYSEPQRASTSLSVAIHYLSEKVLLIRKMGVENRFRDACGLGESVSRGCVESRLSKLQRSRPQQLLTPVVGGEALLFATPSRRISVAVVQAVERHPRGIQTR